MSLQNLQLNRVARATLIVAAIGTILSFGACYCFLVSELVSEVDPDADISTQQEQLQDRAPDIVEEVLSDPPPGLNMLFLVQLGLVALFGFWQAYWAARVATSPEQASGYGLAVGIGVLMTYGVLLLIFGPILFVYKFAFYAGLMAATIIGGRLAGQRLDRFGPAPSSGLPSEPSAPSQPFGPVGPSMPPGQLRSAPPPPAGNRAENAQVYYNMGVSAAIGGRRDEARHHFTRTLQINPRHLQAWLQLANLADSPEQAWDYIQQARSIDPNHPDVTSAVSVVWPQVAQKATPPPPQARPPFSGAPPDQPGIGRSTLPTPPQSPPTAEDVVRFPVEAPPELRDEPPAPAESAAEPEDSAEDERDRPDQLDQ